jgi:hypothetical protein
MRWIEASNKYMRLKMASRIIAHQLNGCAYFVGSALTSETRPRDVDVRIVLAEEVFNARYLNDITVNEWNRQIYACEWGPELWEWHHEQERCGIMVANYCGERTTDLGIISDGLWKAVYEKAPHEKWEAWTPHIKIEKGA